MTVLDKPPTLRPVILPVPAHVRRWPARQRVVFLSRHAREALRISAARSGIELGELNKNAEGTPLPSRGYHWSLTHKPAYVAAVASAGPVGIDLEQIRTVHEGLYRRVAGEDEWALVSAGDRRRRMFFRFWTAKEAVMKAAGTGIKDLSRIKIGGIQGDTGMVCNFRGASWRVYQHFFDNHVAALAATKVKVEWSIV